MQRSGVAGVASLRPPYIRHIGRQAGKPDLRVWPIGVSEPFGLSTFLSLRYSDRQDFRNPISPTAHCPLPSAYCHVHPRRSAGYVAA